MKRENSARLRNSAAWHLLIGGELERLNPEDTRAYRYLMTNSCLVMGVVVPENFEEIPIKGSVTVFQSKFWLEKRDTNTSSGAVSLM